MRSFFWAAALAAASLVLTSGVADASAPTPGLGTLTTTSGVLEYDSAVFAANNPSAQSSTGGVGPGVICQDPVLPCDDFALTVTLPAGYDTAHPFDTIKISLSWSDPTGTVADFDSYLLNAAGTEAASSASSNNPEVMSIPAKGGTNTYTVRTVPFTGSGFSYHGKVELLTSMAGPIAVVTPPLPKAGEPRFHVYFPGKDQGHNGSGEFNIGYNPFSHNIMSFASSATYRTTLPQYLMPALPESCPAVWTDVTPLSTMTGLDPILFTDRASGRTMASNFTAGANALFAYTDDDGANWVQASASPPNLGADHETLATGPYPGDAVSQGFAAAAALVERTQANPPAAPYASYYCSQDVVGPASCQRSDTGGTSFGPGVLIYDGTTTPCGGLHGHAHVSYVDGAVYVPVPNCTTGVGGTVSLDSGTTWTNFVLPESAPSSTDPSIAIDAGNTVYECYSNGADGSAFAQVSTDHGATWSKKFDLGAAFGLQNTVFPHAEAGKAGRASCAFIGTTTLGNHQAADFPGIWYPFIATTLDGGTTWTTVNISPNDPVQGVGGIWNQGGGPTNRNLLDFNEGTQDEHGRTIFGYDDGCVDDCLNNPAVNSFTADSRIAVQSGGPTLWEDVTEPAAPNASCLAGTRSMVQSNLTWAIPDNGGAPITNYKVYRSTSATGPFTYIGQTGNDKNAYVDQTADPNVPTYYYQVTAFNNGVTTEGKVSNIVPLPIVGSVLENVCLIPGLTTLTDASGDATVPTPGTDLLTYSLSQPEVVAGSPIQLVFTIKTDPGMDPQPPGTAWFVSFLTPDGSARGVRMDYLGTAPSGPTFSSYVVGGNTNGAMDGRFVASMKTADAGSNYDSANGIITLVVPLADLGLKVGDKLTGFNSGVTLTTDPAGVGAGATQTIDEMPDGLSRTGAYTVLAQGHCKAATVTPPVNPPSGPGVGTIGGAPTPATVSNTSHGRFGGAFGFALLLPLSGFALARRRRHRGQ